MTFTAKLLNFLLKTRIHKLTAASASTFISKLALSDEKEQQTSKNCFYNLPRLRKRGKLKIYQWMAAWIVYLSRLVRSYPPWILYVYYGRRPKPSGNRNRRSLFSCSIRRFQYNKGIYKSKTLTYRILLEFFWQAAGPIPQKWSQNYYLPWPPLVVGETQKRCHCIGWHFGSWLLIYFSLGIHEFKTKSNSLTPEIAFTRTQKKPWSKRCCNTLF